MSGTLLIAVGGVLDETLWRGLGDDLEMWQPSRVQQACVWGAGSACASWLGCTTSLFCPIDTSSGSDDEGSVQGDSQGTPTSSQGSINMEHWISQAIHGSTTSTTSSSSTQSGGSGTAHRLADVMAQTHIGE